MKKKRTAEKPAKTRQEKRILTVIAVLCALAVCVAGYGVWSMRGGISLGGTSEKDTGPPAGGSFIEKISIGSAYAQVVPEEEPGEFRIEASLPMETDTTQISCTLELSEGAYLSEDSNCIINDLGGQLLLNLGVEDARLVLSNGETDQIYKIVLSISE